MSKTITLKELSDSFDMKVLEFTKYTGYSQQTLYQILNKKKGRCPARIMKEAEARAEKRKCVLDRLKEYLESADT